MTQNHREYPVVELPGGHTTADVAEGLARNIAKETRQGGAYDYRLEAIDIEYLQERASEEARRFARGREWDRAEIRAFVQDTVSRLEDQLRHFGTLDAVVNPPEHDRRTGEDADPDPDLALANEINELLANGQDQELVELLREQGGKTKDR